MARKNASLAAGAYLSMVAALGLGIARASAQDVADLVGIWASKSGSYGQTVTSRFQVTTGPGTITIRWMNTEVNPAPRGFRGAESVDKLYQFTVSGRDLSGTVVASSQSSVCRASANTFTSSGRISPDFQTITIVDNHPALSMSPCAWGPPEERVTVLTRER